MSEQTSRDAFILKSCKSEEKQSIQMKKYQLERPLFLISGVYWKNMSVISMDIKNSKVDVMGCHSMVTG
jgi:hypothetical protein